MNLYQKLKNYFSKPQDIDNHHQQFAFCEAITSLSNIRHIRQLTEHGYKYEGGADTPSLCNKTVSWDIRIPYNKIHLEHCCQECAKILLSIINR